MIRDEEIQRLTNYARGLDLKVIFSSSKKENDPAAWTLDNTELTVYKNNNSSRIEMVLSMIHEIGHALHNLWEKNRKLDKEFEKAIDHVNEAEKLEIDSKKRQRKIILDNEIAGTKYWETIYKETNMQFPKWRLYAQMDFDVYQYEFYYENDSFPIKRVKNEKWKSLVNKYKNKYE